MTRVRIGSTIGNASGAAGSTYTHDERTDKEERGLGSTPLPVASRMNDFRLDEHEYLPLEYPNNSDDPDE